MASSMLLTCFLAAVLAVCVSVDAQRISCVVFVDQSLSNVSGSIVSRLTMDVSGLCYNALPVSTFSAVTTQTQSMSSLVTNATLLADNGNAVESVYFLFFGIDGAWIDAGINYLDAAWPVVGAKSMFYVAPMSMPIGVWGATSPSTSQLFRGTRPDRVMLLDTDPFIVGFTTGAVLATLTSVLERPYVALWFYEFPETARAAIGFAYGVRDACTTCDVVMEGLRYANFTANMTTALDTLLFYQAVAQQRTSLSPLIFTPPLMNPAWQAAAPATLCNNTGTVDGMIVYDTMYAVTSTNVSQICGRVLAASVNTTFQATIVQAVPNALTNFGRADVFAVPQAITVSLDCAMLVKNGTDAATWAEIKILVAAMDASVVDSNGNYNQQAASEWISTAIGVAWNTPKSGLVALGPLVMFADVQFQSFAMFDPRRNLFMDTHDTLVSPVVHYVLATMPHDNNTYSVYAIGGFNATELQLDGTTSANDIYILREMKIQVNPASGDVPPTYAILQQWTEVPPGTFNRPTRVGHSVVVYKDILIAHGGTSPTGADYRGIATWNATSREWGTKSLGLYRHDHSAALYTDKFGVVWMYVFGGIIGGNIQQTLSKYNIVTDTWYSVLTSDVAASNACMVIHDDRIFYYGGIKGTRAFCVISLQTDEIFTDNRYLFGSNLPLDCETVQYTNDTLVTVSSVYGSTALHRLELPVESSCSVAQNQIVNLLMDGCTTCGTGSFADETCKPCGALSNTLNSYYSTYCPDTQDSSKVRVVLSVSIAVPVCACIALGLLVLFYYQSLEGAAHPPFRNPALAPVHGQPAALINIVVDGAPQLWQKAAKHMSTSIESLVNEERRLAAAYGCYEVISAGDAAFYTCRSFNDAIRFALHLHHATESNTIEAVIGTLHLRIVLHSGVVDINDAGAEGMHVSGLAVIHARDAVHSKRQPRGILISDAFIAKYMEETAPEYAAQSQHHLDQSSLSMEKESFPRSTHTSSADQFAASIFHPGNMSSSASPNAGDNSAKPLPLIRDRSGDYLVPTVLPLREGFTIDFSNKKMVCSLEAISEVSQSFLSGRDKQNTNKSANDPLNLVKLRTGFPGARGPGSSIMDTNGQAAVSMMSADHDTDDIASATESMSSLSQLFLGWETHPLISMGVLSQREFQCMARIVQRMYEAVLSPLTDMERKVVQDAMAEHLRLYVDSDPMSKQRNRDVAMRVLQIVDMLYIKEVAQTLLGAESDEGTSEGQASSTNVQD